MTTALGAIIIDATTAARVTYALLTWDHEAKRKVKRILTQCRSLFYLDGRI
ncbi:MAG: hypothetical protein WBZ36_10450 [Candidatus Nitrosopolaris sp.]